MTTMPFKSCTEHGGEIYYQTECPKCKESKMKENDNVKYCRCSHSSASHTTKGVCFGYSAMNKCMCETFVETKPVEAKAKTGSALCACCNHDVINHDEYSCHADKDNECHPTLGVTGYYKELCRCSGFRYRQENPVQLSPETPERASAEPLRLNEETVATITRWANDQSLKGDELMALGDLANARKHYTIAFMMFQQITKFRGGQERPFPNLPPNCS